ncbi:MAG: AAA family ATPase [Candidatus Atabeyarchaeum deiterrae]
MLMIILCGLPCSGKTKVATLLARKLESNYGLPTLVVDPDRIREMVPAMEQHYDPKREPFVYSLNLLLIEEGLKHDNIVISDDMNYYESTRHRLAQVATRHGAKYIIVYLTVSLEVAQERNAARDKPIPIEIISETAKNFDQPGTKYKWDRPALVIDSEKSTAEDAVEQVIRMVLSKIKEKSVRRKGTEHISGSTHDEGHAQKSPFKRNLDKSTRRILNGMISAGSLQVRLSKEASKLRRAFISEISKEPMSIADAEQEFRKRVSELIRGRT